MKQFIQTLTNTYKTFQMFNNPQMREMLSRELQKVTLKNQIEQIKDQTYYHKYFFVQVVD